MSEHKHSFTELTINPIKRVQDKYDGSPGDRAFLTEKCSDCPKVRPRDYGKTEDMELKLEELETK